MRGIPKPTDPPFPESNPGSQDSTPCLSSVRWGSPLPMSLWPPKLLLPRSLARHHPSILTPLHPHETVSSRGAAEGPLCPSGSAWAVSFTFNLSSVS